MCHCPCHSDLHHDRPSDFEEDHFLTYIAISFFMVDGRHPSSSTPYSSEDYTVPCLLGTPQFVSIAQYDLLI